MLSFPRHTGYDANLTPAVLQTCAQGCKSCGDGCERHAEMHEHCRICAEACRRCEQACQADQDAEGATRGLPYGATRRPVR